MRYKFFVSDNKVVCVSSYAGKAVRGIAKCDPKDTFNVEAGKQLAQARCDFKIAEKRVKRSAERYDEAIKLLADVMAYKTRMENYKNESYREYMSLKDKLADLESSM